MPFRNHLPPRTASQRALAFEATGDLPAAFDAWEAALAADPQSPEIAALLADLAFRLGEWAIAEAVYANLIARGQTAAHLIAAYTATLREQGRYDDVIEVLKTALGQAPGEASLWEALGAVMAARGDNGNALIFFNEALRLDPGHMAARFLRGVCLTESGHASEGLRDLALCADGFEDAGNRTTAQLTYAQGLLASGDLTAGWRHYEARHRRGTPREVMYDIALPRHSGPVEGKRLFISGEQGLGDEVLFGSMLPDIAARAAHIGIGVEPRLVSLFARSFPDAEVVAHRTRTVDGRIRRHFEGDLADFDSYALMGDFLAGLRPNVAAFPAHNNFLTPDPARIRHWRGWLDGLGGGRKIGLLWKSLKSSAVRDRQFAPWEAWAPVLAQNAVFIALQYGDVTAEIAAAKAAGVTLHTPPGIDLMNDLDDLAALCVACDLIIGPSNATTNIAAACGAGAWLISAPSPPLAFGTGRYPWYPKARLFTAPAFFDWAPVMAEVAAALSAR